jgi:hypothetical protein
MMYPVNIYHSADDDFAPIMSHMFYYNCKFEKRRDDMNFKLPSEVERVTTFDKVCIVMYMIQFTSSFEIDYRIHSKDCTRRVQVDVGHRQGAQ